MFASKFTKYFIRRPFFTVQFPSVRKIPSNRCLGHPITLTITRTFRHGAKDAGKKLGQASARRTKVLGIARFALAGGSVVGLGALCSYGLGVAKPSTAIHLGSIIWPDYIKQRIHSTYMYFGSSLIVTAVSAFKAFQSPILITMVTRTGFFPVLASLVALIGSQAICLSIPYKSGFGLKQIAWIFHSVTVGIFLAPLCFLGGPILVRAAWYTAGIVGGLSIVACCAPSDTFLYMAGPLAMGLGVVVAASIGSMFLPPTSGIVGAGLYSMSLYGGLLVMAGFIFFDTQRIIVAAETHVDTENNLYDPVNMSVEQTRALGSVHKLYVNRL